MQMLWAAVAAFMLIVGAMPAAGHSFPAKPVRIVVPFPAGGAYDVAARIIAQRMGEGLGQNVLVVNVTAMAPFVRTGRLRGLVVTSRERAEVMADTPTVIETGFPQRESTYWGGLIAPSATPAAIVARLNDEAVRDAKITVD
jgi:tripartite-type tricarboxylate transporter receptor subunit TctC